VAFKKQIQQLKFSWTFFVKTGIPFFNGAVEIYAFAKKNLDYSY
jgi:hypothetical protein